MLKLYKHQEEFLNQRIDRSALVWSCGTGKTRTAIEWAKQSPLPVLIVCPKPLKTNWKNEIKRWGLTNAEVVTKEEFKKIRLNR